MIRPSIERDFRALTSRYARMYSKAFLTERFFRTLADSSVLGERSAAFVNRIWPTLILRFGPPPGPTILSFPGLLLFSVAPAGAKPSAAAFAARLGEA